MLAVRAVSGSVAHSVSGEVPKSMLERCWWRGPSWWHHCRCKHQGRQGTLAMLRVNISLGLSGEPSHMSRRTQYTYSERNTANVVHTLIRRRWWQAQTKYRLTVPAAKPRPPNKRRKTQANLPKLPITWTMHRPLQQTCHTGIHYMHTTSIALCRL